MQLDPTTYSLATRLTSAHVLSARPDAPVVPDAPRRRRFEGTRDLLAHGLRSVARWVEPTPRTAGQGMIEACAPR